jgi:oligoendopeptidase F
MSTPPRWDMTNIYPSLESAEFQAAVKDYKAQVAAFGRFFDNKLAKAGPRTPITKLATLTGEAIDRANRIRTLSGTIGPYIYAFVTTDSHDQTAKRALSEFEQANLPMDKHMVRMRSWLGKLGTKLTQVTRKNKTAQAHAFMLKEAARLSRFQMGDELEGLASEMSLSGGNAWEKLQGTLNKRRGRKDAVHASLDAARIDRKTLEAMFEAMRGSFPMFRRYFRAKAQKLGKEKLAWWDVFAPMGKTDKVYSFEEARDFILHNFGEFSPDLRTFAQRAFDKGWIDAEQREGKRGGAFCMGVAAVRESRVLCNFDGSFDQVSTIAHELGHGFHNECAYAAGKTELQQLTPMTLAETASTMCETIVTEAVLASTKDPQEKLAVLEAQLQGAGQVVVDIYSRYLFEKEIFERREEVELSPEDFNEIMERAQKATYGEGLDERYLQKFMWTWKPHYYSPALSFYNFPYAFGLLFATGLYAIYKQRGLEFVPDYKKLLASTGEASAASLAKRFGIDIRTRKFWDDSLAIIGKRIDRFSEIQPARQGA